MKKRAILLILTGILTLLLFLLSACNIGNVSIGTPCSQSQLDNPRCGGNSNLLLQKCQEINNNTYVWTTVKDCGADNMICENNACVEGSLPETNDTINITVNDTINATINDTLNISNNNTAPNITYNETPAGIDAYLGSEIIFPNTNPVAVLRATAPEAYFYQEGYAGVYYDFIYNFQYPPAAYYAEPVSIAPTSYTGTPPGDYTRSGTWKNGPNPSLSSNTGSTQYYWRVWASVLESDGFVMGEAVTKYRAECANVPECPDLSQDDYMGQVTINNVSYAIMRSNHYQYSHLSVTDKASYKFDINAQYPIADSNIQLISVEPTTYTSTPYAYEEGITWTASAQNPTLAANVGTTIYSITLYGTPTANSYSVGQSVVEYKALCSNVPACSGANVTETNTTPEQPAAGTDAYFGAEQIGTNDPIVAIMRAARAEQYYIGTTSETGHSFAFTALYPRANYYNNLYDVGSSSYTNTDCGYKESAWQTDCTYGTTSYTGSTDYLISVWTSSGKTGKEFTLGQSVMEYRTACANVPECPDYSIDTFVRKETINNLSIAVMKAAAPQRYHKAYSLNSPSYNFFYSTEYNQYDTSLTIDSLSDGMFSFANVYYYGPYAYYDSGWAAANGAAAYGSSGSTTYRITVTGPPSSDGYGIGETVVEYRTLCSNVPECV